MKVSHHFNSLWYCAVFTCNMPQKINIASISDKLKRFILKMRSKQRILQ